MLRSAMEMGNVGTAADLADARLGHNTRYRGGAVRTSSRMSTTSSRSNTSNRQAMDSQWAPHPGYRSRPHPHEGTPQYAPDTLSPTTTSLPFSSPLMPPSIRDRNGQRSQSMTTTSTAPPALRPRNNRSAASLGPIGVSHQRNTIQHPMNAHGFRQPLQGDLAGEDVRRQRHPSGSAQSFRGYPHQAYQGSSGMGPGRNMVGQNRSRNSSESSINQQGRAYRGGPHHGHGPPHSSFIHHPEMLPPVPAARSTQHHMLDRNRGMSRYDQRSFDSDSTNLRTDSDSPSSDIPIPSTPHNGSSVEVFVSQQDSEAVSNTEENTVKEVTTGKTQEYFDYGWEEQITEPDPNMLPGPLHVHRRPVNGSRNMTRARTQESTTTGAGSGDAGNESSHLPNIAELEASPVGRPITRENIRNGLGPFSSPGDILTQSDSSQQARNRDHVAINKHSSSSAIINDGSPQASTGLPVDIGHDGQSILTQPESSIMESSTVDAVRTFVQRGDVSSDGRPAPMSPAQSTSDGLSELIARYDHTD